MISDARRFWIETQRDELDAVSIRWNWGYGHWAFITVIIPLISSHCNCLYQRKSKWSCKVSLPLGQNRDFNVEILRSQSESWFQCVERRVRKVCPCGVCLFGSVLLWWSSNVLVYGLRWRDSVSTRKNLSESQVSASIATIISLALWWVPDNCCWGLILLLFPSFRHWDVQEL